MKQAVPCSFKSKKNAHILILDDDRDVLLTANMVLKQHYTDVITLYPRREPWQYLHTVLLHKKRELRYRAEPVEADHEAPPGEDRCRNGSRCRNYLYS